MKDTEAYIERVRHINDAVQHLELAVTDSSLRKMKAGQSLLVRFIDSNDEVECWDPYLRQQWWPVGVTRSGTLLVERPASQRLEPRQYLSLLGPVGEPYRFRRSLRNVLLVAYNTSPTPLLMAVPALLGNKVQVTMVLLGSARGYSTSHLHPELEIIHGGDGLDWPDQVMTFGWADQIFAVVAPDDELLYMSQLMQSVRDKRHDIPRNYIFGVFQSALACGTGACYTCALNTARGIALACVDGPALDLTKVLLPASL